MDDAVADIFGYHALQLGLPERIGKVWPTACRTSGWRWCGCQGEQRRMLPRPCAASGGPLLSRLPFPDEQPGFGGLLHALELSVDRMPPCVKWSVRWCPRAGW